jgi:hypothetical protein
MGAMPEGDCFAALAMTVKFRTGYFVIASGAKQSRIDGATPALDCFVALSRASQ